MKSAIVGDEPSGSSGRPDVSIIVVSYNTRDMTLECVSSIVAQTLVATYETIVVDNDSSDGSAAAISRQFPEVKLIALDRNVGFGRANNLAVKQARGRRILLLNPDTIVLDQAIDRLVEFAESNPAYRVWGGRTLFPDGSLNRTSCFRRISLWNLLCFALGFTYFGRSNPIFNSEAYGGWDRNSKRHVDIVTGCFLLIDRPLWDELGGFDPTFFMYGEEADLCQRARSLGARPAVTPDATIVHYGGASDTVPVDKRVKVFKGRITLINRHFGWPARKIGQALHLVVPLTRWCGYGMAAAVANNSEWRRDAEYWRAVWKRRGEWGSGYQTFGVVSA